MLVDAPRDLLGTLCKFLWDCTVKIVRAGDAASDTDDCVGENKVVPASLYYLC